MPSEAGAIILYDQTFGGAALPETGAQVSEETRLRAAPIGVYELSFRQQPQYQFSGAFLFNDQLPDTHGPDQQKQFDVLEDTEGSERTLMMQSNGDVINLESVELIPLDWRENPLEFTQLTDSKSERTIRYRKEPPPESLKLKLSGVNVFDVETINTALWAQGRNCFPGKLAAYIRRSEDIRIDRLDNSRGPRKIEEHLLTLFRILLEKDPNRTFDFECSYRYDALAGGPHVFMPVLVQKSVSLPTATELLSTELLPHIRGWYQDFAPPAGLFDFGVKVYGAGPRESVPVLHLTGMVLPIESIAGWSETGTNRSRGG